MRRTNLYLLDRRNGRGSAWREATVEHGTDDRAEGEMVGDMGQGRECGNRWVTAADETEVGSGDSPAGDRAPRRSPTSREHGGEDHGPAEREDGMGDESAPDGRPSEQRSGGTRRLPERAAGDHGVKCRRRTAEHGCGDGSLHDGATAAAVR
jgi:hypothetical protein